jgi:plastocyanin
MSAATMRKMIFATLGAVAAAVALLPGAPTQAQQATVVQVTYANNSFQPSEVRAPADTPIVVRIKNLDGKAMEFESRSLRVEKVVAAKSEGLINVRPLKPGRYEFFDDFNDSMRGALTVQ